MWAGYAASLVKDIHTKFQSGKSEEQRQYWMSKGIAVNILK